MRRLRSVDERVGPESFDGIPARPRDRAHAQDEAVALLRDYLPYLRRASKVFFVCPQERGYASDPTHVRFTTGDDLADAGSRGRACNRRPWFSFPFPTLGRGGKALYLYTSSACSADAMARP